MNQKQLLTTLLIATGLIAIPAAAASYHSGGHYSDSYEREYHNDDSIFQGRSNYQRGGLAHDYFHTDQFFGREIEGFPDTAFGEDSRYDARRSRGYNDHSRRSGYYSDYGLFGQSYNERYDSGPYGAYSDLALRYGEGFVAGEGFGDEYIGDPDQLDERIYNWQ